MNTDTEQGHHMHMCDWVRRSAVFAEQCMRTFKRSNKIGVIAMLQLASGETTYAEIYVFGQMPRQ